MLVVNVLFWLVAARQVAVAIRFVLLIRKVAPHERRPAHLALARGQCLDGLLSAVTLWGVVLSKGWPLSRNKTEDAGIHATAGV